MPTDAAYFYFHGRRVSEISRKDHPGVMAAAEHIWHYFFGPYSIASARECLAGLLFSGIPAERRCQPVIRRTAPFFTATENIREASFSGNLGWCIYAGMACLKV
jgi:hypothetical protein